MRRPILDARGNGDGEGPLAAHGAGSAAGGARPLDDLPVSAAVLAHLGDREEARVAADLPRTPAGRAQLAAGAFFRAGALAGVAALGPGVAHLGLRAERRLDERHREVVPEVRAVTAAARAAPAAAAAAEERVEEAAEIPEKVLEALEDARELLGGGVAHALEAREPELVVGRPLPVVGEHLVRLGGLLEPLLGRVVAGVAVRVVLDRELPVRPLDLVLRGSLLNPEDFVEVALGHRLRRAPAVDHLVVDVLGGLAPASRLRAPSRAARCRFRGPRSVRGLLAGLLAPASCPEDGCASL